MDNEELIKFWKSSAFRSGSRNFLKDSSQHCATGHFSHNLAHVSGKTDRIVMKIFTINVTLDKEVPVKFWKLSGSDSGWDSVWRRFCAPRIILF